MPDEESANEELENQEEENLEEERQESSEQKDGAEETVEAGAKTQELTDHQKEYLKLAGMNASMSAADYANYAQRGWQATKETQAKSKEKDREPEKVVDPFEGLGDDDVVDVKTVKSLVGTIQSEFQKDRAERAKEKEERSKVEKDERIAKSLSSMGVSDETMIDAGVEFVKKHVVGGANELAACKHFADKAKMSAASIGAKVKNQAAMRSAPMGSASGAARPPKGKTVDYAKMSAEERRLSAIKSAQ